MNPRLSHTCPAGLNAAMQALLLQHAPELCRMLYRAGTTAPAETAAELQRLTAQGILTPGQAGSIAAFYRSRRAAALLQQYRKQHPRQRVYNAAFFEAE